MWENMVQLQQAKDDKTIRRMHLACWITKATDTHSEYVTLLLSHGKNGYADAPELHVYSYVSCLIMNL